MICYDITIIIMVDWINLSFLFYLGKSKKHHIFRAKKWDSKNESILKKPVYDQTYKKLGVIQEIFGPINMPFVSIKTLPKKQLDPNRKLYVKVS
ncbi:MAG: H/ACA RNA-protein complex component Gar1 [Promethearchaeota archaeon]|nr:MAG: H/ACA RNA-protein complex component Gar1 [Candidatus Lokiarchaeota archaeon]